MGNQGCSPGKKGHRRCTEAQYRADAHQQNGSAHSLGEIDDLPGRLDGSAAWPGMGMEAKITYFLIVARLPQSLCKQVVKLLHRVFISGDAQYKESD